ncbi:MAG: hypothetical protein U1D55_00870 [Phycisphaerae bacterium]
MYVDPVVAEIRRNAEEIAELCCDDVHRMAEYFREAARQSGRRVIARRRASPPTGPPDAKADRPPD